MKKAFFFVGLAAAALSFVGCNKEADLAGNGRKAEIVLSNVDTRTVNDGMSTNWVNDDALTVFVAPAGSTEYGSNNKFVVDDAASNHASGTVSLESGNYDWYLLYPYESHITTPANTNAGYLTVGSAHNKSQTQAGINNKEHLAGKSLPVYGIVKNVPAAQTPVVSMKHVAAVICVNVTNGTTAPIKVTEVSFTAPVDIIGTYYIDFSSHELGFKGSGNSYVSKTASLTVTGDDTIAAGASGKFYMAVKPFEAKSGESLTLKVTADGKEFEKTIAAPANLEFKNGYIKTLNITYAGGSEVTPSTLAQIATMDDNTSVQTNEVLVVAKSARGIMLAENGNYLQAYKNAVVDAEVGDIVTVSGKVGSYAGMKQINSPEVTVVSSNNTVTLPSPKVLDATGMDAYNSSKIELIQYVGKLTVSGSYYNVEVTGATKKGSIQYPLDTEALNALKDKGVTATGFCTGFSGSSNLYINMMTTSVVGAAVNLFDVTPSQIDVPATATSTVITVTGNVDWTAEASAGAALDTDHGTGAGTITVTFPANEDTENVKEYTVFVRTTASGVNDEFAVEITQAKADVSGFHTVTIDFSQQGFANGTAVTDVTVDGVKASFDKGTNNNAPKYYDSGTAVRMYGSNSMTVTASGKTIVSIDLVFGDGDGTNVLTTNVPTFESPTWTGEAGSVTFTVGGTTGQRRIKAITVKYSDETAPVTAEDPTLNVPETLSVEKGKTAKIDVTTNTDGEITYTSANTAIATVAADGTVTGVAAGTTTITVAAAATTNFNAASAPVTVTVTEVDNSLHTLVMEDFGSVSFTSGVYSFVAAKADASNDPTYNSNGKDLRIYAKGTLTVTNSKENMTKIVFNLSSNGKDRLAAITASTGTIAPQATGDTKVTWTGNANEVVFTVGEKAVYGSDATKNGQFCFTSVGVAPWSDGDVQPKTLESIEVSGQKTTFTVGDTFSFGGTVTAVYSDGSRANVTESATFSSPDMSTAGEKTVTVSYTDGGVTKTTTYTIMVDAPISGGLTFDFSDRTANGLDQWPSAAASAAEGTYVYVLDGKNYSFTTTKVGNGIYMNTSYMMFSSGNYLGLPAIEGKKLVSVSATLNAGGNPSTAAKGTITSDTSGTLVTGGDEQTFDTKGGAKTFDLTGTSANTVYYLAITNKNFQCTKIVLVYE